MSAPTPRAAHPMWMPIRPPVATMLPHRHPAMRRSRASMAGARDPRAMEAATMPYEGADRRSAGDRARRAARSVHAWGSTPRSEPMRAAAESSARAAGSPSADAASPHAAVAALAGVALASESAGAATRGAAVRPLPPAWTHEPPRDRRARSRPRSPRACAARRESPTTSRCRVRGRHRRHRRRATRRRARRAR